MMKKLIKIKYILIVSLLINILVCFPLVSFLVIDGNIQQQIYMHCAAHFGKYDIAFIGDSITLGGHVWASKIGVYNFNIWNYGAGGFTTEQVKSYAERAAEKKFKYCFIMSGRNDDLINSETIDKTYKNYITNIQILTNAHVEPIVTLVIYKINDPYYNYIGKFNELIRSYCVTNNIMVIDLNKSLCNEMGLKKEFSIDGTHINGRAYSIWGQEIHRVLHEKGYI